MINILNLFKISKHTVMNLKSGFYLTIIITIVLISWHMTSSPKLPQGFSYITDIDPTIKIQARYAISQNFRGQIIKGYQKPTVIISTVAGIALKSVQKVLNQLGYGLLIYDGYRPQKAVDDFIAWTQEPQNNKTKAQFYPYLQKQNLIPTYIGRKSGHTRGSTVDLTIIRLNKQLTDIKLIDYTLKDKRVIKIRDDGSQFMCGHFDLLDEASHHDTKLIDQQCTDKRDLLRTVMKKYGFRPLQEEWWHYTLDNQPFPNIYFNFDVQ